MFDERLSHARKEVLRFMIRVYCWGGGNLTRKAHLTILHLDALSPYKRTQNARMFIERLSHAR